MDLALIVPRCVGCGTAMTEAELLALKKADPRVLSCCPERNMQPPKKENDHVRISPL